MGKFDIAIKVVLDNEGSRYENDPFDRGGECKYGVTNDDLSDAKSKGIVSKDTTIKNLTKIDAMLIYKALYYNNCPNLERIESQAVINKILDMRVNIGPSRAIRLAQEAINNLGTHTIAQDGIMGAHTTNAINNTKDTFLLAEIRRLQIKHYNDIIKSHPTDIRYHDGWMARVKST